MYIIYNCWLMSILFSHTERVSTMQRSISHVLATYAVPSLLKRFYAAELTTHTNTQSTWGNIALFIYTGQLVYFLDIFSA